MGIRTTTFILIGLCFLLPIACSKARQEVVFWPANIVKKSPTDLIINDKDQIVALRTANPTNDAIAALLKNDLRFIVDAPAVGRIQGVPYDNLVNSLRSLHGCKLIAFSNLPVGTNEFRTLKENYEVKYNMMLYSLLSARR